MSQCIQQQDFDTQAFGIPFYRIVRFDVPDIRGALKELASVTPRIIDAKVPAHDRALTESLLGLGFRLICTQFELEHDLAEPPPAHDSAQISDVLPLTGDRIRAHAANFEYDRFSMDPMLSNDGVKRLYERWIGNSLGGRKRVAHVDGNFCTFGEKGRDVVIDLVSVVERGRGIGFRLMNSLVEHARGRGMRRILVTTECENQRAWRLYLKCGFRVSGFQSVLHFVAT